MRRVALSEAADAPLDTAPAAPDTRSASPEAAERVLSATAPPAERARSASPGEASACDPVRVTTPFVPVPSPSDDG